jgi:signal transduction histidine kinase
MLNPPKPPTEEIRHRDTLFNISNCIRHCLDIIQSDAGNHKFICVFDPPIKLISGHEEQIAQVVAILITNAIKYSPQTAAIEIRTSAENGKVKVSVTDHGVGITTDKLKTLFKTLSPNASPSTGLQIAATIIERHNGQIGAESYVDVGSTFWFTLPV